MKRARSKTTKRTANRANSKPQAQDKKAPFMEHVQELRRRLFYIALSVAGWSAVAYAIEHKLVAILLRPARHQQFIYTSPGGGIDFLFRVCVYFGIAASIPVIVYQILRYIQPLLKRESMSFIGIGSVVSGILAVAGMLYGYFWGLPSALNFLLHQFVTSQIKPLVTIQSYMAFVTVYMLGSALLFQVPLFIIFINRIKPLKPRTLFKYERHVAIFAVLSAALMNPTPNVLAQAFIAGPIILMYQVGIAIVWATNRSHRSRRSPVVQSLFAQDAAAQSARQAVAQHARPLLKQTAPPSAQSAKTAPTPQPPMQPIIAPRPQAVVSAPASTRSTRAIITRQPRRRMYDVLPSPQRGFNEA